MISLTLLPSNGDAKLGAALPIVGRSPSTTAGAPLHSQHKRSGLSFDFGSHSRNKARAASTSQEPSPTSSNLKVRLADDSFLVPFLNRPLEVRELIFETEQNKEFSQALQLVFSNALNDWQSFKRLLCEISRDEMQDKKWLMGIYSLLFHRSPTLWCRMLDCLGAHGVDWGALIEEDLQQQATSRKDNDEFVEEDIRYESVFSESGSSFMADNGKFMSRPLSGVDFEALHDIPHTFRSPAAKVSKHSYRHDEDEKLDQRVDVFAAKHPALRHRRNSSVISTGEDEDVHAFLSSKANGFAGLRMSCLGMTQDNLDSSSPISSPSYSTSFSSHSRSFSVPSTDGEQQSVGQLHKFTHHRRLSSLFMSKMVEEAPQPPLPTSRKRAETTSNTVSLGRSSGRSSLSRSMSARLRIPSPPSQSNESPSSPPQTNATFASSFTTRKKLDPSLAMTSPTVEESSQLPTTIGFLPDGRTRHPSAGEEPASKEAAALLAFKSDLEMSKYAGHLGGSKERNRSDSSSMSSILSPTLSELSYPTSVSTDGTSPELSRKALMEESPPQQKQSTTPSIAPKPSIKRIQSPEKNKSHLIFPFPSSPQVPRSKRLIEQLNDPENQEIITAIKQTIQERRFNLLVNVVTENERSKLSDESLLEWIAKDCFLLIDQEKESQDVVEKHLLDEEYEKRWSAFVQLCGIWNVDNVVMSQAKRRGGPAVKLF